MSQNHLDSGYSFSVLIVRLIICIASTVSVIYVIAQKSFSVLMWRYTYGCIHRFRIKTLWIDYIVQGSGYIRYTIKMKINKESFKNTRVHRVWLHKLSKRLIVSNFFLCINSSCQFFQSRTETGTEHTDQSQPIIMRTITTINKVSLSLGFSSYSSRLDCRSLRDIMGTREDTLVIHQSCPNANLLVNICGETRYDETIQGKTHTSCFCSPDTVGKNLLLVFLLVGQKSELTRVTLQVTQLRTLWCGCRGWDEYWVVICLLQVSLIILISFSCCC